MKDHHLNMLYRVGFSFSFSRNDKYLPSERYGSDQKDQSGALSKITLLIRFFVPFSL